LGDIITLLDFSSLDGTVGKKEKAMTESYKKRSSSDKNVGMSIKIFNRK
jgi:hypothetical protein